MASLIQNAERPRESWPVLISLDAPNLPRLDPDLLPAWAGEYARALSAFTETPAELPVAMVLAVCATAVARAFKVEVYEGYCEPCNLWLLAALVPGTRKSAVQSAASAPLQDWESEQAIKMAPMIQQAASDRQSSEIRAREQRLKGARIADSEKKKQFLQEAADCEAEIQDLPVAPRLWTSDSTPEKLGMLLAAHGERMAWLSSEGGVFDMLQGRYSNSVPNLDLILKSHSGDPDRVDRGSRPPLFLKSPLLTIGLSPQPEILRGLASKPGFRGRGLLERFLYLLPPSPLGTRKLEMRPIPPEIASAYREGIKGLLALQPTVDGVKGPQSMIIQLSEAAKAIWQAYREGLEIELRPGNRMDQMSGWAGKAPGAVIRIAGVLHAIKHSEGEPASVPISETVMKDAVKIMDVVAVHSLAALDLMGADPAVAAARDLWRWIERGRRECFPMRDAFNALRARFPRMEKLKEAGDVLVERGYVEITESPRKEGAGRPASALIRVRPDIVDGWA